MFQYPQNFFITSGHGSDEFQLVAFDNALISARISNYNLVKISSILPIGCERSANLNVREGSPLLTAFGTISSNIVGDTIASAVAVGIPVCDSDVGVIMEYANHCTKDVAEERVRHMVEIAMANHNISISEIVSSATEITVQENKFYSVVSAISIW